LDTIEIRVAHSPDSDDAFMFYALATGKLDTGPYRFVHTLRDIESLNRAAMTGEYEVSAVSIHAYAYVADKYALLPSGASMGERYGPVLVSRAGFGPDAVRGRRIAVPGKMTSAYLALKLFEPEFSEVVAPFDEIMGVVGRGEAEAGLLIHEGQLTYAQEGFRKILDLGEWWHGETGLPLPLGGNGIRRDLGTASISQIARLLRDSIQYSLDHREAALAHAMTYARGLEAGQADRFVGMYVNERTLDYGPDGRRAVRLFLDRAFERGLIPHRVEVDFVDS
jgi:1,4-dihydroxy-6-naphthoate synthase